MRRGYAPRRPSTFTTQLLVNICSDYLEHLAKPPVTGLPMSQGRVDNT